MGENYILDITVFNMGRALSSGTRLARSSFVERGMRCVESGKLSDRGEESYGVEWIFFWVGCFLADDSVDPWTKE